MSAKAAHFYAAEDIVSLSDFKADASNLLQKLRETGRPMVLTDAGRAAAVLLAPEEFDDLHDREQVIRAVERGRADLRAGRVIDDEQLTQELDARFGESE